MLIFVYFSKKRTPPGFRSQRGSEKSILHILESFQDRNNNSAPLSKVKSKAAEKEIKAVVVEQIHKFTVSVFQ
jgi:hypothetical protein